MFGRLVSKEAVRLYIFYVSVSTQGTALPARFCDRDSTEKPATGPYGLRTHGNSKKGIADTPKAE